MLDLKPSLFDEKGRPIKFWHGATYQFGMKFLNDAKQRLESLLGGRLTSHFPIMLTVDADIFGEKIEVDIQGFGSFAAPNQIVVVNSG